MSERLYTRNEVAKMFRVTPRTVDRWIKGGMIAKLPLPHIVRIPESELSGLLKPDPVPFDDAPTGEDAEL